tara:strand:+ start:251 stop:1459 length:1209 start_codon:yes stop_codon:yes gene_type:complete
MTEKPFPNTKAWKSALSDLRENNDWYILLHTPYKDLENRLDQEQIPWLPAKGHYWSDMGPRDGYCNVMWFCVVDDEFETDDYTQDKVSDSGSLPTKNQGFDQLIKWIKRKSDDNPKCKLIEKKIFEIIKWIQTPTEYETQLKTWNRHIKDFENHPEVEKGKSKYRKDIQKLNQLRKQHSNCCNDIPDFFKEWNEIRKNNDWYYVYNGNDKHIEDMLNEMNIPWINGNIHYYCTSLPHNRSGYYGGPYRYTALWVCKKTDYGKNPEDERIDAIEVVYYRDYVTTFLLNKYIQAAKDFYISKWSKVTHENIMVYTNRTPKVGDVVCFDSKYNELYILYMYSVEYRGGLHRFYCVPLGGSAEISQIWSGKNAHSPKQIKVVAFEDTWKKFDSKSWALEIVKKINF